MPQIRQGWLNLAIEAVQRGGAILREGFGQVTEFQLKSSHMDLVTEYDRRSEESIIELLRRECPEHGLLSEEGSSHQGEAEYLWIIDPLDGTTNYAHGYPLFAISAALTCAGQPLVGAVYAPILNELFVAERGTGAFLNGQKMAVSRTETLKNSLLATGFPVLNRIEKNLPAFQSFLPLTQGVRRDGSAALDLCFVACGRFDGFWELDLKPWDTAAAWLIIEEAGGRVTDLRGGPFNLEQGEILASNGRIHQQMSTVVEALKR
jgi:myo-inositol-1(or 4)-monophosphatase